MSSFKKQRGRRISKINDEYNLKRFVSSDWDEKTFSIEGVDGLRIVRATQAWHLCFVHNGKQYHKTFGNYPAVSLAEAINRAKQAKEDICNGKIQKKPAAAKRKALPAATRKKIILVDDLAAEYFHYKLALLKSQKTNKNPVSTVARMEAHYQKYIKPVIGMLPPNKITSQEVAQILSSITNSENTRKKTKDVLSLMHSWFTVRGYIRLDESIIDWRRVKSVLPPCTSVAKKFPRLAIEDVPRFVAMVLQPAASDRDFMTACATLLLLLTAQRCGSLLCPDRTPEGDALQRFSKWKDIDFERRIWSIPPECMKVTLSSKNTLRPPMRIPLSAQTAVVLNSIKKYWRSRGYNPDPDDFVLAKVDDPALPHKSFTVRLFIHELHTKDIEQGGRGFFDPEQPGRIATTHGFRSDFQDWCMSRNYPIILTEKALAHESRDSVQQAYQRSDLLEERRAMMQDWADYCWSMTARRQTF
jgi:integrase